MGIRYIKKQEDPTVQNVADPWNIIGIGRVKPVSTREVPKVALCGSLTDVEIATYLDGNASPQLILRVQEEARQNPALAGLLRRSQEIDEEVGRLLREGKLKSLPLTAMAATDPSEASTCGLRCEEFVMARRGLVFDESQIFSISREQGWLQKGGTRIGDLGNVLQKAGLRVTKQFDYTFDDLRRLLDEGKDVIAVVDGGELVGDRDTERLEDKFIGEIPDHAVVVTRVDDAADTVEVFDPQSENERDTYPREQFADAWEDSGCYLVVVES